MSTESCPGQCLEMQDLGVTDSGSNFGYYLAKRYKYNRTAPVKTLRGQVVVVASIDQ